MKDEEAAASEDDVARDAVGRKPEFDRDERASQRHDSEVRSRQRLIPDGTRGRLFSGPLTRPSRRFCESCREAG